MNERAWIGLDIGGANLKAAHSNGESRSVAFELWKHYRRLPEELASLIDALPHADALAVTMTAELCDCYASKAEGVEHICRSLPSRESSIHIFGCDGRFHSIDKAIADPLLVSASNWTALATHIAMHLDIPFPTLLIDIGTTTTDLIPLDHGKVTAKGLTDTARLRSGELVYAGVRRTPICALACELNFHGEPVGLAAELFATTLDVYLTLHDLPEDPADCSTADGRPATKERARDRLARMIGADHDGFSKEDSYEFARELDRVLTARIVESARRVTASSAPNSIIVAGSGEFLARRVAEQLHSASILSLSELWSPAASESACAYAVLRLAEERIG